ncbi:2-C-methyl-D-erythritol 4-phosphate cytidylyltransferase [Babesia caballi]|uniref:2-C-methyl-D-erythritol 4-phosphate cytidylyltransferase n=1 Tax=Babesia caballi TaxID=5871 RepID=A0AAV4LPI6_BABCB|nr:2-C-methyl-D-erythritol 4-phosphate cytidylyltransferase [Babesia caballi]
MSASLSKLLDSSNAEATLPSDCPPCKQFVFLNGAPVFVYSLSEFLRSPLISEITIATKPEWNLKVLELVDACTGALLQRETPDPERSKCKTTALEVNIESAAQLRPPESQDASLYRAAVHDALRAEYERHLTKFPYFFYDLVERRCVLGDAASWKDATKTAKGDSQQRYKMISLCTSGKSRASTVYNALLRKNALGVRLPGCCRAEYIALVHDAVRPLLRCLDLGGLINAARIFGAAVPAVSVADTIKVATTDSGCTLVANTPSRSTLFAVQTPQAFRSSLLKRAYASVMGEGDTEAPAHLTDDSSFVEQLSNARVAMVPGHRMNVKLTTWEDIAICSRYLKEAYSPTAES